MRSKSNIVEPPFSGIHRAQVCVWRKREKIRVLRETEKTRKQPTPEQTDDADENEAEMRGNEGKVDCLSGYEYGPEIPGEKE